MQSSWVWGRDPDLPGWTSQTARLGPESPPRSVQSLQAACDPPQPPWMAGVAMPWEMLSAGACSGQAVPWQASPLPIAAMEGPHQEQKEAAYATSTVQVLPAGPSLHAWELSLGVWTLHFITVNGSVLHPWHVLSVHQGLGITRAPWGALMQGYTSPGHHRPPPERLLCPAQPPPLRPRTTRRTMPCVPDPTSAQHWVQRGIPRRNPHPQPHWAWL